MAIRIRYSFHALQRMYQRKITVEQIRQVIETGITIEIYPDDTPWPSQLRSAKCGNRPIHVVSAWDLENEQEVIITVYEPNPREWSGDFTRRVR